MFVIAVKFGKVVRYIHEIFLIKHAEPYICYNRDRYNRVWMLLGLFLMLVKFGLKNVFASSFILQPSCTYNVKSSCFSNLE